MPRYIDVEPIENMAEKYGYSIFSIALIKGQPTADVVEISTNELTKKISERIIQALEANYDIIPKKPMVRCKDCKHLEILNDENYYARCKWHGRLFDSFGNADTRTWFCADGERREDG